MKKTRTLTLMGILVVLFWAGVPPAQAKRPMTIIDLLNVPSLRDPRLSPDGKQLLYVLAEADWDANKRISHIWRIESDGTDLVQLTNGSDGESAPRWSPDGESIAFVAKRGEKKKRRQIYLLSNRGGEARALTKHDTSVSGISWSPDGAFIYFVAPDPKTEEEKEREEAKDDVFAFDENYKQRHLWKVAVVDGTKTRMTVGDYSIRGYELSRDGTTIAFHRAPTPLFDDSDDGEIWVMNASGDGALRLTNNGVVERGAQLSPDNTQVLFLSDSNEAFDTYYNDKLFLIPAGGGRHQLLLPDMPYEVKQASWSADGKSIYFTANTGVRVELFQVDVATENVTTLTEGEHTLRGWTYFLRGEGTRL